MLVHICCSVDSHYFLSRLQRDFPNERLVGYFYNPNIHPQEEHDIRLLDVVRSCDRLEIPLLMGAYELESWMGATKGLEKEPEKGERCLVCFDERLKKTVDVAKERGEWSFTTTLLMSPKKSFDQLKGEAARLEEKSGLEFVFVDYRKGGGTQEQFKIAKEQKLYMQDYCGCMYALTKQRGYAQKEAMELYSDISDRALPNSLKERKELYKKRGELETTNTNYTIIKESFLNYRLKRAFLKINGETVPSYTLFYSSTKKEQTKSDIVKLKDGLFYAPKFEGFLVSASLFNELAKIDYNGVSHLIKNPPSVESELKIREMLTNSSHSLSPIIVVDKHTDAIYELFLQSEQFIDLREVLIEL